MGFATHAEKNAFDDAILLDHEGYVAEASAANIFCIKDGFLLTPMRGTILCGITRDTIIKLPGCPGPRTVVCKLSVRQLLASDEVFLCGTAYEVTPVREIGGTVIGNGTPGPITRLVQEQYRKAVHGELLGHEHWLTYV